MGLQCAVFNQVQQKSVAGIIHLREPIFVSILAIEKPCSSSVGFSIVQIWCHWDYCSGQVQATGWLVGQFCFVLFLMGLQYWELYSIVVRMARAQAVGMGKHTLFLCWLPKDEMHPETLSHYVSRSERVSGACFSWRAMRGDGSWVRCFHPILW